MGFMPTDKKSQNTLAIGIIALVLAFGFYWFRYKKVKAEIVAKQANIETLTTLKTSLQGTVARYGNLGRQLKIYEQHMTRLEELIPQRQDVPALLYSIAEQAQIANVAWGGISPTLEEPVAYYSRELYAVKVSGGYHEIGSYLAGIASLRRIIKVADMNLTLDQQAKPRGDGLPTLTANFVIETYVIPGAGETRSDTEKAGG